MPKILVIDDSAFQRSFLRRSLESSGYSVVEARNGDEALEQVAEEKPDAILTDLIMPDMRGLTLIETLNARGVDTPIVVLTADIQEPVQARCLELGARRVLHKPARPETLASVFREVIGEGPPASGTTP